MRVVAITTMTFECNLSYYDQCTCIRARDEFIIKLYNFRTHNLLVTLGTRPRVLFFRRRGNGKRERRRKCAKRTREGKGKLVGRETGARSRKLAAMLFPVSLSLSLLPPAPPTRLPRLHAPNHHEISSVALFKLACERDGTRGRSKEREGIEQRCDGKKKDKERERERETGPFASCARGKIKSLSDALRCNISRMRIANLCPIVFRGQK